MKGFLKRLFLSFLPGLVLFPILAMGSNASETATAQDKPQSEASDWLGRDSKKSYFLEGTAPVSDTDFDIKSSITSWFDALDEYQESWGGRVNQLGNDVDEMFGDDEHFQNFKGNRLEVSFPINIDFHHQSVDIKPRFRAKFPFPNSAKRLNLIVESTRDSLSGADDNSSGNTAPSNPNQAQAEEDLTVTVRGNLLENEMYKMSLDLGGGFQGISPDPMVGLRLQAKLPTSDIHINRLIQKLYWQRFKGEVADTQYRHDWLLNRQELLRFNSGATWWNEDVYWHLYQDVTYYDMINPYRTFSYSVRGDWDTKNVLLENRSVGFGFNWREKIYQNWAYVAFNPYLLYNHEEETGDYHWQPTLSLSLEIHFYEGGH